MKWQHIVAVSAIVLTIIFPALAFGPGYPYTGELNGQTYNNGYGQSWQTFDIYDQYNTPVGYGYYSPEYNTAYYPTSYNSYGSPDAYMGNGPDSFWPYGSRTDWNSYQMPGGFDPNRAGQGYGEMNNMPYPWG